MVLLGKLKMIFVIINGGKIIEYMDTIEYLFTLLKIEAETVQV